MIEQLSDLDELALRCRGENARQYIAEALSCYRASGYRAAVVMTWIAVVFDLIEKLKELSLSGDVAAKLLLDKFETYQKQIEEDNPQGVQSALRFERELIFEVRNKLQLFDHQVYVDLCRLREDRHQCAHPTFHRTDIHFTPSAEQARLHLRNAIVHVLSQPPVQGKAALNELRNLVSSRYFPESLEQAKIALQTGAFSRPSDALVKGFVDLLVFKFFEKDQPLKFSSKVVAALSAVIGMHRQVAEPRARLQINKISKSVEDSDFLGVALIALDVDDGWSYLDIPARDKVRYYIEKGPDSEVISLLKDALLRTELEIIAKTRIENMTVDQLSTAINTGLKEPAISRALSLLLSVRSWTQANEVFDKTILPLHIFLTPAHVRQVILSPKTHGADLPGSTGFRKFLGKVRNEGPLTNSQLTNLLGEAALSQYAEPEPEQAEKAA